MNKKILIAIICAVLVFGGGIAAVSILKKDEPTRKRSTKDETSTTTAVYTGSTTTTEPEEYTGPTDENGLPVYEDTETETDSNGNIITTVRNVFNTTARVAGNTTTRNSAGTTKNNAAKNTTRSNATTKSSGTTKKNSTTKSNTTKASSGTGLVDNVIGPNAEQSFLGYRKAPEGYYYCDDKDNWQRYTGYNEVYDKWAGVAAMYIDQVRIRFRYEDKNWMIQLWKGQYGFLMIGAEIGVYTNTSYSNANGDFHHFDVAEQSDWLYMQLDCYYRPKGDTGAYQKVFTRPWDKYWWATGFVKGQLSKYSAPRTELKTMNHIQFKSTDMANLYVEGLQNIGFARAGSSAAMQDDTYFQNGADVYVLWATKYNDSFDGYMS